MVWTSEICVCAANEAMFDDVPCPVHPERYPPKKPPPSDADGKSFVDYQQRRGVAWDIIEQALAAYDHFMGSDDYEVWAALRRIMGKMRERHDAYHTPEMESEFTEASNRATNESILRMSGIAIEDLPLSDPRAGADYDRAHGHSPKASGMEGAELARAQGIPRRFVVRKVVKDALAYSRNCQAKSIKAAHAEGYAECREDAARVCEEEAELRDNQAAATTNDAREIIIASHNTAYELAGRIRALTPMQGAGK